MSTTWDPDDVFRGGDRPPSPPPRPASPSHASTTTSSSSSSSSHFGRIGAIAAVVELLSRWAASSASSDSSSSHSRRTKSLHDISNRIGLLHAREQERQAPRNFLLYLPPSQGAQGEPVLRTTDLSQVLSRLNGALHRSNGKHRQARQRLDYMLPEHGKIGAPSRAASFTDLAAAKGKSRQGQPAQRSKAWFLDVSSPNWDDMRAIGQLLHLHPLTLEDVLVQDHREKLEHFDRLGYYFLSFTAIKSWDHRGRDGDQQGSVAESNVYLVVFKEGVCCFSFTDVSEHTDRVRNRLLLLDSVANMSSDWIAHGILDSIVDSFFPFLSNGLEKEVMGIEDIVFSQSGFPLTAVDPPAASAALEDVQLSEKDDSLTRLVELSEKSLARLEMRHKHPLRAALLDRLRVVGVRWWDSSRSSRTSSVNPNTATLQRMARARRLVTSLSRLLASKSEIIAQFRKRLLTPPSGASPNEQSVEVAIYLGDVQDHIITLESSLGHYERMLSQSHPLYISQVRTGVSITKGGTDKALLYLTSVSMCVLCIQTFQGIWSINVKIPTNSHGGNRYYVFGIVLIGDVLILVMFLSLVRSWWRRAKRRPQPSL
uniref:Uncharacterized protein n=1 Tax=Mycena chlorophos TaxID=658473 RepID=A0ABQ0KZ12_MYCCL|nr:predicted protein [Mycena chlorophos]